MSLTQFRRPVVHVDADTPVSAAARAMRDQHVGCLIVTRDQRPIGIVTDRDLVLRVLAAELDPATTPLSRCVTYDPITALENESVATAVGRMRNAGVRRIPIVDHEGRIVGIVTTDDLFGELGHELSELCEGIENSSDATDAR